MTSNWKAEHHRSVCLSEEKEIRRVNPTDFFLYLCCDFFYLRKSLTTMMRVVSLSASGCLPSSVLAILLLS